jgi:hypothetical protein
MYLLISVCIEVSTFVSSSFDQLVLVSQFFRFIRSAAVGSVLLQRMSDPVAR